MEIINLNLIPGKAWPVAHATQFDKGREFRANLFEGSQVYTLAGDETVDAIIKKPDGNQVIETLVNTADNYVIVTTTEQMTAVAGPSLGEIRITKDDTVIGSLKFILECEQSADTGIESHSEINNLETQVAAIVADQYDADNVVFDAAPTAGHGVGFAVTSEGVKTELDLKANSADLATVATSGDYNDLSNLPTIPTDLDDLADVTITTPSDDDILVYQNGEWVNMANPASTANFADAYDPTATYNTGDVCIYNNVLYIGNEDNITGTFDPTKWTATTIDNVIGSLSTLTTTDKSSIVGAVNEVNAKATMSTGALTGATSAVSITRGNFWQLDKMIFACGAFTMSGAASAGLSLVKFPTGVSVPSALDMVCFGADNKAYNCYAYLGNIVANTTMPAQVYIFNFVARVN